MNIVCIEMEIRELIGIMNDSLNIVCIEIQSIPPWNLWVWRIYPYFDDNFHVLNARRVLRLLLVSSPATPRRRLWLGRRAHCHQERGNWYIWRFPKVGTPKSSIYRWIFNYKPSILGHPRLFHPHTLEFWCSESFKTCDANSSSFIWGMIWRFPWMGGTPNG